MSTLGVKDTSVRRCLAYVYAGSFVATWNHLYRVSNHADKPCCFLTQVCRPTKVSLS